MKKLKLNLDDLKVETFETTPSGSRLPAGTVRGYLDSHVQDPCTEQDILGCTGGPECTSTDDLGNGITCDPGDVTCGNGEDTDAGSCGQTDPMIICACV